MDEPPLVENAYCADIFATGFVVYPMDGSGCVRLVFYADQTNDGGRIERSIVAKIVRPIPLLVAGDKLLRMARSLRPLIVSH